MWQAFSRARLTDTTADEGEEERGVSRHLGRNLELCSLLDMIENSEAAQNVPRRPMTRPKTII